MKIHGNKDRGGGRCFSGCRAQPILGTQILIFTLYGVIADALGPQANLFA